MRWHSSLIQLILASAGFGRSQVLKGLISNPFNLLGIQTTVDDLTTCGIQLSSVKDFDRIVENRAERHQHLRGRKNVTSCRSPPREFNSILVMSELKKKRHLEFLRRRSVSPEVCGLRHTNHALMANPSTKAFSMKHNSLTCKSETLLTNIQNTCTANEHPGMVLTPNRITDGPSSSNSAPLWSEQVKMMRQKKGYASAITSISTPATQKSDQHWMKHLDKRENSVTAPKTSIRTFPQTENIQQKISVQRKMLRQSSAQTESGLIPVQESEVQQLADYLQEALWREEALKKKLAALQEKTSNLINSSKLIWTARCSEDVLRNTIKAQEAQLQVCLQNFPKDGVKKMLLQMEKEKSLYEEKVMVTLQRTTQERTEARSKAAIMQEGLISARAEALRWQSLYEELKLSKGKLMENHLLHNEQLQQLHSQVELSRAREAGLTEEVGSLRHELKELQYNIYLLEDDNQMLREEIQHLRNESDEGQDFKMQRRVEQDSQVEEQLRHIEEKLQHKESKCEELQTELDAMEQEFQSSQARLSQCREELRQLSHRPRRMTLCVSWLKVLILFLLLVILVDVAALWFWYPTFREKVEDIFSDIETRFKEYLMEMASPQHSGCFRPI